MNNITTLNKRPYLTAREIFNNLEKDIGTSDRVLLAGLDEDGTPHVYSTNSMSPSEELYLAQYVSNLLTRMALDANNLKAYREDQFE